MEPTWTVVFVSASAGQALDDLDRPESIGP